MRPFLILPLLASGIAVTAPAMAQTALEPRVDRLEREMRAVQRRVFPGGGMAQQVEPEITAPAARADAPGTPAAGPVAALTSRVEALESQQASMLEQVEQTQYQLRQLQEAFNAYRRTTDGRLNALSGGEAEPAAAPPSGSASAAAPANAARGPGNGGGTLGSTTRPAPAAATPAARPAAADPARAGRVAAVERPATGDAAEDAYVYGFRLWQAKLYPEAQAALKTVVDRHAGHRRASYAQNLIGRAYLDDGKPSLASVAFYENYKKWPNGERAPDSLFYLAQSLTQLNKTKEACDVYGELTDVYQGKIAPAMQADIAKGRTAAKCAA